MFRLYAIDYDPAVFDESFWNQTLSLIPENRRRQILSLHHPGDKYRSALAYLIVVNGLMEDFGMEDWPDFIVDEKGHPTFDPAIYYGDKQLHFSISHKNNQVLAVISDCPCGIDIERVDYSDRGERTMRRITNRFFSDRAKQTIDASQDPQRTFTRLFALQEALAKKEGRTLAAQLTRQR